MNVEHELRSTSDTMLATLDELARLEGEKREAKPDSARFRELAREIEHLAGDVYAQTHKQEMLAQSAETQAAAKKDNIPPINEIEITRELPAILSEWRDAERTLAGTKPRSAEHARAAADVSRLRSEVVPRATDGTER